MKKRLYPLFLLISCLALLFNSALTAFGGNKALSGEVVAVQQDPAALVLQTNDGKRIAVLLEEDTYISGMDGIDGEAYKAAPHTGVSVYFFPEGRGTSLPAEDGETLKAYHADSFIGIDSYLVENAAALSDGTALDAWKNSGRRTRYQLKDGTELLREDAPSGPENHYVGSLESFDDLSESAKPAVRQHYAEQGQLYDLPYELERAYAEYLADPEGFSSHWVSQDVSPTGSNSRVMYFQTNLILPTGGNTIEETHLLAAFDRETGAYIPTASLFSCPGPEIGKRLLDLAEKDGWPDTPALKQEMLAAFRLEYVTISSHGLYISYPQGTLPSQEYGYGLSVDYDDGLRAILHPWAVPDASGA